MSSAAKTVAGLVLCLGIGFLAGGAWWNRSAPDPKAATGGARRILYYHDPMHPAYKSDKPGIAPDCGMQLEPVYSDEAGAARRGRRRGAPLQGEFRGGWPDPRSLWRYHGQHGEERRSARHLLHQRLRDLPEPTELPEQIGRASCRARV